MLEEIMEDNADLGQSLHMLAGKTQDAVPVEGTKYTSMAGDIAIVDLIGPIYPRANAMTSSGATSIAKFTSEFFKAYENPAVKGLVMNIDSPGGDVRGIGDAANMIYNVSKLRKKPIKAFVSGYGASAAYYIGSAAQDMKGSESSIVGSIGTVLTAKAKSKEDIEIVSSQSPKKRPDATTEEGSAILQQKVDDLASVFVKDVAKFRGVGQSKVLSDYGQGDTMIGVRALSAGLLDGIGTLSSVIAEATREAQSGSIARINRRPIAESNAFAILTFDDSEEEINMGLKELREKFLPSTMPVQAQTSTAADESDEPAVVEEGVEEEGPGTKPAFTREELEERFATSAELFATQMTLDSRIFPSQQAHAASDLLNAMADDVLIGETINFVDAEGQMAVGTREAAVRARYQSMPKHSMTTQAIKGLKDGSIQGHVLAEVDEVDKEGPTSEERKNALLATSQQGRAVLASHK